MRKNYEIIDFRLLNKKIINLKFRKNLKKKFIAKVPPFGIGKIMVDELFFKFLPNERIAIMHHELWHYKNNLKFEIKYRNERPWLWFPFFFISKPILHEQEYNADMHAFNNTKNKKDMINALIKLKKMIKKGIIPKGHGKTHPPIKERIKKLKKEIEKKK